MGSTTAAGVLYVTGTALQIAGIGVAAAGYWKTWRQFAPLDQSFLDPLTRPIADAASRVVVTLRRLVGRGRPAARVTGVGAVGFGGSLRARGRVQFGELPPETDAAVAELGERTRQLADQAANLAERLDDEIDALTSLTNGVGRRLDQAVDQLDTQSRKVAVGGLRAQSLGLLLVAIGLVLQSASAAM